MATNQKGKTILVFADEFAKFSQYQKSLKEFTSVTTLVDSRKACIASSSNNWVIDSSATNHMTGLQYYFFPTDFYYPRPVPKISTDDVAVKAAAARGSILENPVSDAAMDRRDMSLLQDKILKVSTPLSMNLVRYQSVLVSKNDGTNWRTTTNYQKSLFDINIEA